MTTDEERSDEAISALAATFQYYSGERGIAAGGCTTWPYIGDFPPQPLPGQYQPTILGTGTNTQMTTRKGATMDVYMIWAITPDQPDAPWLVSAWDSESRAENEDGWLEDLAAAEEINGARNIRVTRSSVNYDAIVASFEPVEV